MFSFCKSKSPSLMKSGCIHEWTIEQFTYYHAPWGSLHWKDYIESEIFKPKNCELDFYLRLYPHGKPYNRDYVSLALCLKPGQVENVKLKVTFEIEDKIEQKLFKKTAIHNLDRKDQFVCEQFIGHADLYQFSGYLAPMDTLTICCVIEEIGNELAREYVKSSSCIHVNALSHTWTVKDFVLHLTGCQMNRNEMYSPDFSTRDGKTVFYLSLLPNGDPENHLSVYLHLKNENCDTKFNFAFFLKDTKNIIRNIKVFKNQKLSTEGWGVLNYISHADLMSSTKNYLINGRDLEICVVIEDCENKLIRGYEHDEFVTNFGFKNNL